MNDLLDPKHVNSDTSLLPGKNIRESRDSDEHPNSVPIAVIFDETGSMGSVPRVLQTKLVELFGLLLRKGYVEDPQILMGAVGDAYSDVVPLQVGQFESDNRIDANLEAIFLEGNGGGQTTESYELAAYFLARHTVTDAWEKRAKRGFVFIIGDEQAYPHVNPSQVRDIIGGESSSFSEKMATSAIFDELKERYHVFLIRPEGGSYHTGSSTGDRIVADWRNLLGPQNVITIDDDTAVCETIAVTIGIVEGTIDLDEGLDDLKDVGSTAGGAVGKALAVINSGSAVAVAEAPGDLDIADDSGITRL